MSVKLAEKNNEKTNDNVLKEAAKIGEQAKKAGAKKDDAGQDKKASFDVAKVQEAQKQR